MKTIYVTAFVDWDTARRCVQAESKNMNAPNRKLQQLEKNIEYLKRQVATALSNLDSNSIHRVTLRFYHGWFQGKTRTEDRMLFEKIKQNDGRASINKITFPEKFIYCEHLLSDKQQKYPLYDTLRSRDGNHHQKMIDTSITCDVLEFVRSNEQNRLAIVVGADDDLLPAVFTANTWNRKAYMLRINREHDNKHLNTSGLILRNQGSTK